MSVFFFVAIFLGPFALAAAGCAAIYRRFGTVAAASWLAVTAALVALNLYLGLAASKQAVAKGAWTAGTLEPLHYWFLSNPIVIASAAIGYALLWLRGA